jgi:hypothetical protein
MWKRIVVVLLLVVGAVAVYFVTRRPAVVVKTDSAAPVVNSAKFSEAGGGQELQLAGYTIRTSGDAAEGKMKILRGSEELVEEEGGKFLLDACKDEFKWGTSLTGDGVPGLAVAEWSGGAHCCFSWKLYRLGKEKPEEIGSFETGHSDGCPVRDVNGDQVPEVVLADWTFAYWNTSFADSPAFEVIHGWKDGKYVPRPDLMKKAAPADAEIAKAASEIEWDGRKPSASLWAPMLRWIATGNANVVPGYLDKAWPASRPGREAWVKEFDKQLRQSENYKLLEQLNGGKIELR